MIPAASHKPLMMIGAGGHGRVLHALALALGRPIAGVYDPMLVEKGERRWNNVPVLGGNAELAAAGRDEFELVNGVGQLVGSTTRRLLHDHFTGLGFSFATLVHPAAWVANDVVLSQGVQVMAGAIVQPGCAIGEASVVNTRAGVDHDCVIGRHVHLAPGATLCGTVEVGEGAFVGAGAIVVQNRRVGAGAVVAAGATAARDVPPQHLLMPGMRAKPL
jgi:UDP-perosamine 4-acetyltransferase